MTCLVLRTQAAPVNLLRQRAGPNVPTVHYEDPPGPSAVIRGILGVAAVAAAVSLAIAFVMTGHVAWKLLALFLALWGAWSFFGQLFDTLVSPLGRFFAALLRDRVSAQVGPAVHARAKSSRSSV